MPAWPHRVETFTSENNELWKKVETLENANRWVLPPAPVLPLPPRRGEVTEFRMNPRNRNPAARETSFPSFFIHT